MWTFSIDDIYLLVIYSIIHLKAPQNVNTFLYIHIFIVHICLYFRRVLRKCCVGVLYAAKVFESLIICHLHFLPL